MREVGGLPIVRKITSMKKLSPCQQKRLKELKEIFMNEGRIPLGTSPQEARYLTRLEAGRRHYRWRRRPPISESMEAEARRKADPYLNLSIEEILANLSRKKDEPSEVSEG